MNIVYVSREYPPSVRMGGIASYVKEIASGMRDLGHSVTVITASDDTRMMSEGDEDGIHVIRMSGGDFWLPSSEKSCRLKKTRCIYRFLSYRRKIRKAILSLPQVDLVEVADYAAEGLFLGKIQAPVVVRLHTPSLLDRNTLKLRTTKLTKPYGLILKIAEKHILLKAKYVSSCSRSLLKWIQSNCDFNPRVVSVIKNPVSLIDPSIINASALDISSDIPTIFYAGTISQTKGTMELYEACKMLNNRGIHVHLIMAGKKGEFGNKLQSIIDKEKDTWCHLIGHCPRYNLYKYYRASTICCFPSWWENMPMVCIEAMMCGGLVVGGNVGGVQEIIRDGENGFLVPIKNSLQLANYIEKVLALPDSEKNKIRQNARETIMTEFSTHIIAKKMEQFYLKVLTDFKS